MPVRVSNAAEHTLFADPPKVITVAANTATILLPNEQGINSGEIAYRYVQNVGSNPLFYSFALTDNSIPPNPICDGTVEFHGVLPQYAQLDCSNHRLLVSGYSTAGTTVATTIIRRKDMTH